MKGLIIVGAGGLGREVYEWCKDVNAVEPTWDVRGFIDDAGGAALGCECEIGVVGTVSGWVPGEDEEFAMAIANPATKEKVAASLEARGARFASVIHPSVRISSSASYGRGVVMYPGAMLGPNCRVGDFATILGTGIGHDAVVGDYATVSSYCGINGHVEVGRGAYVASHACIHPSLRIGDGAFVGMGSVVIRNVRPGERVFGNPAKRVDF